jgi:putative transcriptional regulator
MAQAFALRGVDTTKPYHYTQCGLDDVYLMNGYVPHDTPYGMGVSVQNVEQLHQAIADHLVNHRALLSGREIRFLRKQMDITQAELGTLLRCNQQTIARWEKGQTEINGAADAMIKLLYLSARLGSVDAAKIIKELAELDDTPSGKQVYEETADGWRKKAA